MITRLEIIDSSTDRRHRRASSICFLIVLAVLALGPANAIAQPCIQFFQDENYGGERWSYFCGDPEPAFSAWNDEITSMIVPEGYKVSAFEHSQFGGSRQDFIGSVANVGADFNDFISSWKLEAFDSSRCVTTYKDENYSGETWLFCPSSLGTTAPPHSRWNDNISSFRIPPNFRVKFCKDLGHDPDGTPVGRGLCRSYFRSISLIGPALNDEFSYIEYGPFEPDNFNMVIMSDPQFWFCNSSNCQTIPQSGDRSKSVQANDWHAETIKKIRDQVGRSRFAGVIVNGDLIHGSLGGDSGELRETQLNNYYDIYERRYQFNVWPGLGNHDYDNDLGYSNGDHGCNRNLDIAANGDCTIWMMRDLADRISGMDLTNHDYTVTWGTGEFEQTLEGSFSYSWDVGDYHFVQLHNHPAYKRTHSAYLSGEGTHVFVHVNKSLQWLENDLDLAGSKNVIINLHVMSTDGLLLSKFGADNKDDYLEFRKILGRHPNVKAIFAGHIHHWAGQNSQYDTKGLRAPGPGITTLVDDPASPGTPKDGRLVPVFFSGSGQYNLLLKVRFRPDDMTVLTINTRDGNAPCINTPGGYSCPGVLATKTLSWAPPPPDTPPPPVQLTVEKISTDIAGIGTGSVVVPPSPLSTGSGNFYALGTMVELAAAPSFRSEFVTWAGAAAEEAGCTNVPDCTLRMDADTHVQAIFTPRPVLHLETRGGGSASSTVPGDTCSSIGFCSMYSIGDMVGLVADANPRSVFDHWEGDPDCSDSMVTMDQDKTCIAVFRQSDYLLTVRSTNGLVVSNESPGIIDCGSDCSELYPAANGSATLVLTASADPNYAFVRWYGDKDCWDEDENDGVPERISLTVGAGDLDCSAKFVEPGTEYALTVDKLGVQGATISAVADPAASADGIDCPLPSCAESFPVLTVVQLSVSPVRGSKFEGWDGHPDCVDGEVTMTANIQCSARFTAKILIVDGSDNDNLRNEYISVLNSLPDTDYDEWSVASPNSTSNPEGRTEPILADLAPYSRVIWYTGNAFSEREFSPIAGPSRAAEIELAGYLDAGGCLLVTSPQYLMDRGRTQFVETYLGVTDITSNGGQTQISGAGLLPGFNSLGEFQLEHNSSGLDPSLTDSALLRDTRPGNEVLFEYSAGGEAAVTRDNGIYRTALFNFPFLALKSGNDRIDVMGAFLDYCLQISRDDVFEINDDFASATGLEGDAALMELRIMPGNDDYFRWQPDWHADTRFSIGFPHDTGDLALEVYDQARQFIASSQSAQSPEEIVIADVNPDQTYYVRVYGLDGSANRYSLVIKPDGPEEGDMDGDGVGDADDAFADDPLEQTDADGDGIGDNSDDDDDNDGMLDSYEIQHNLDPFSAADAGSDPDEDEFTNLEESEWQTDPHDENSTPPTFTNSTLVCDGVNECTTVGTFIFGNGFE